MHSPPTAHQEAFIAGVLNSGGSISFDEADLVRQAELVDALEKTVAAQAKSAQLERELEGVQAANAGLLSRLGAQQQTMAAKLRAAKDEANQLRAEANELRAAAVATQAKAEAAAAEAEQVKHKNLFLKWLLECGPPRCSLAGPNGVPWHQHVHGAGLRSAHPQEEEVLQLR